MTRDPLTDPQPGDVVRARDERGVAVWLVVSRDGDEVTLRGMALDEAWTWTEPVAKWADWTEWRDVTAIPVEPDPLEAARLASESAEAEVRALTEALEAARRRSLEAYAAWAVAVSRGLGDVVRALRG